MKVVCLDSEKFRPTAIPAGIREKIQMPSSDLSFVSLISNASVIVQLVMALLLLAPVYVTDRVRSLARLKKAQRRPMNRE